MNRWKLSTACSLTLLFAGCRAPVDESAVAGGFTADDARYAKFCARFPEAETTVSEFQPPRTVPVKRYCLLRSHGDLADGYGLAFVQRLEIDSNGKLVTDAIRPAPRLQLTSPVGQAVGLNASEFDVLMETDEIEAALGELGIDFSLPEWDDPDLVALLGGNIPEIEDLLQASPDARTRPSVEPFRSEGRVRVSVPIGDTFSLDGEWSILFGQGGQTVTAAAAATYELWNSDERQLPDPSAIGFSVPLTADEAELLVSAPDRESAAATMWAKRSPEP